MGAAVCLWACWWCCLELLAAVHCFLVCRFSGESLPMMTVLCVSFSFSKALPWGPQPIETDPGENQRTDTMVRTAVASYVALLLRRRLGVLVGDSHLEARAVLDILRSRDRLSAVYTSWGGQTVHDSWCETVVSTWGSKQGWRKKVEEVWSLVFHVFYLISFFLVFCVSQLEAGV